MEGGLVAARACANDEEILQNRMILLLCWHKVTHKSVSRQIIFTLFVHSPVFLSPSTADHAAYLAAALQHTLLPQPSRPSALPPNVSMQVPKAFADQAVHSRASKIRSDDLTLCLEAFLPLAKSDWQQKHVRGALAQIDSKR